MADDDDEAGQEQAPESDDEAELSQPPAIEGLPARHARFVNEYLVDRNATQAAIRAGYSPGPGARVTGCRLLQKPNIAKAVAEGEKAAAARAELSLDALVEEFRRTAFATATEFRSWGPNGVKAKIEAMKALGHHLGMYTGTDERKIRRAVEELLEQVKPRMSAKAHAELVTAIGEEMGLEDLCSTPPKGGSGGGASPVH
jgi:phage terminase small subunit